MVKHFRFLYDLQTLIPGSETSAIFSEARPGTLLSMLHSQLHDDPEAQYDMYEKFINRTKVLLLVRARHCDLGQHFLLHKFRYAEG